MDMAGVIIQDGADEEQSRKATRLRQVVLDYQESFSVIEKCPKPVIAAIHSACVGGGVDMVCACDIRLCAADAWFQVKVMRYSSLTQSIYSSVLCSFIYLHAYSSFSYSVYLFIHLFHSFIQRRTIIHPSIHSFMHVHLFIHLF